MLKRFFGRDLKSELYETKKVVICGVRFKIKKVNLLNYLDGSQVLVQKFDLHKTPGAKEVPVPPESKIRKHYSDILVAGVAEPRLVFKAEDGGILVDDLFINWEMVTELYTQIMTFTYGKKKVKQLISVAKSSLK